MYRVGKTEPFGHESETESVRDLKLESRIETGRLLNVTATL